MDTLELKSVRSLLEMNFFIPSYQRGYRWSAQQVADLLDDIYDFSRAELSKRDDFYCLQPLVVQKQINDGKKEEFLEKLNLTPSKNFFCSAEHLLQDYSEWVVIDGQQRLTSVYLILKYLRVDNLYSLKYETRGMSSSEVPAQDFLNSLGQATSHQHQLDSIDFHHFYTAYESISDWFSGKSKEDDNVIKTMKSTILDHVQFIWYVTDSDTPIKVFTRLNIGKISLTNAELIKALFLNRSNFPGLDDDALTARQNEIAHQWDEVETTLQNDEFWLFINPLREYERPTRIDFIFDLIFEKDILRIGRNQCGNDDNRTFRYFEKFFKSHKEDAIMSCWNEVMRIFDAAREWYDDITLYHYVGFLITCNDGTSRFSKEDFASLYTFWNDSKDKDDFLNGKNGLISKISTIISGCYKEDIPLRDMIYECEGWPKAKCRPILLLHNIQTIIAKNEELKNHKDYLLGIQNKFPFHLYKKEKGWDIEHIDSDTPNENLVDWLKNVTIGNNLSDARLEDVKKMIESYDENSIWEDKCRKLIEDIYKDIGYNPEKLWDDPVHDKNKIWNYTLLDMHTNRSYQNAMFSSKRRVISGKDRGVKYVVSDDLKIHPNNDEERQLLELRALKSPNDEQKARLKVLKQYSTMAFIAPCTANVFLKYYSPSPNNLISWGKEDAEPYMANIENLLSKFLVRK